MTAVEAPRVPGPPPGAGGRGGAAGPPGGTRRRTSHLRVAAIVVVLTTLVAGLATFGIFLSTAGHYQSTAEIVFTNTMPDDDNIAKGSRYVQDRITSWEGVAGSEAVSQRAVQIAGATGGTPFDPGSVTITGKHPSGTELLQVTATSANPSTVAANATTAAQATIDVVVASEAYPGTPQSKIAGTVVTPGGPVVDHGVQEARWWGVLGGVGGFIISLLACSLLRPGRWARDLAPHTVRSRRRMVELNATVMGDEMRGLLGGLRRPEGKVTVGLAAVSIAGYGATGSMIFPLLVVVVAAVWTWRTADPRWSAVALLFTGVGVFPEKVDVVKLGPVTPTVLEVALLLALLLTLRGRSVGLAPRSAFAAPVIAILVAATIGAVSALALGGEFGLMIDNYRAILMVAAFFPVYFAFARRPHQLVAVLLYIAGVCSAVVLVAAAAGWSRLLVDERTSVITGSSTSDVARLSGPTLNLWAPLLVLLLSALMPRKPRWLWLGLLLIGILHEAASFNRSTWAPLVLLIVAVAAVTHGPKGLVRRAALLIVVGAIGFSLALTGLAGGQAKQIALRASSVVTGQAYGEDSLPDRLRENAAAYATLERQPWLGVGVGQYYGGELITYDNQHSRTVVDPRPYIHNQYLRILVVHGRVRAVRLRVRRRPDPLRRPALLATTDTGRPDGGRDRHGARMPRGPVQPPDDARRPPVDPHHRHADGGRDGLRDLDALAGADGTRPAPARSRAGRSVARPATPVGSRAEPPETARGPRGHHGGVSSPMTVSSALRKAWWVLVLGAVLGAVVGLVVDLRLAGADFTSSSQVLISGGGSSDSSDSAYNANQYINQRMSTYAQLASSDQVIQPASRQLGIDSADLTPRVTSSIDGDTTVLTLNVTGSSPDDAVRADQAVTQAFTQALGTLETPPGQPPRVTTKVISDPSTPADRHLPPAVVFVLVGAAAGLLLVLIAVSLFYSRAIRRVGGRVVSWIRSDPSGVPRQFAPPTGANPMVAPPPGYYPPPGRPLPPPPRPMGPPPPGPAIDPTPTTPVAIGPLKGAGSGSGSAEATQRVARDGEGSSGAAAASAGAAAAAGSSGSGQPGSGQPGSGQKSPSAPGPAVGAQNAGAQNAGAQNAGAQNAGSQKPGAQNVGAQKAGAQNAGAQNAGAQKAGAQNAGAQNAGAQNPGAQKAGAQGPGSQGPGSQGPGNQGPGNQGPGNQGPGNQGPGQGGAPGQGGGQKPAAGPGQPAPKPASSGSKDAAVAGAAGAAAAAAGAAAKGSSSAPAKGPQPNQNGKPAPTPSGPAKPSQQSGSGNGPAGGQASPSGQPGGPGSAPSKPGGSGPAKPSPSPVGQNGRPSPGPGASGSAGAGSGSSGGPAQGAQPPSGAKVAGAAAGAAAAGAAGAAALSRGGANGATGANGSGTKPGQNGSPAQPAGQKPSGGQSGPGQGGSASGQGQNGQPQAQNGQAQNGQGQNGARGGSPSPSPTAKPSPAPSSSTDAPTTTVSAAGPSSPTPRRPAPGKPVSIKPKGTPAGTPAAASAGAKPPAPRPAGLDADTVAVDMRRKSGPSPTPRPRANGAPNRVGSSAATDTDRGSRDG